MSSVRQFDCVRGTRFEPVPILTLTFLLFPVSLPLLLLLKPMSFELSSDFPILLLVLAQIDPPFLEGRVASLFFLSKNVWPY